jgi:predicted phosphodiesterase
MVTKYGVISDVHSDPRIVPLAIKVLRDQGAQKLLVNGDIGTRQPTLQKSQEYIAYILDSIGKGGLESFVQPGSHETVGAYAPVIDYFASKYPNIVDVLKNPKSEQERHDLVFLPGSDFLCRGEYSLNSQEDLPTGGYIRTSQGLVGATAEQYLALFQNGFEGLDKKFFPISGYFQNQNMNDLRKLVVAPEKTIVVCHVPRKFNGVETCVDMSHFWQGRVYHKDPTNIPSWTYTELTVSPINVPKTHLEREGNLVFEMGISEEEILTQTLKKIAKENVEKRQVFVERKENRGNEDLKTLYEELGITKAVSGHFHESGHRANDSRGNHVPEGKPVRDLFWNSGHLDSGKTGILSVDGEEVNYQNINLRDYLR